MRLLLLNQFYPPDTAPTGVYLHDLARTLAARGHEIKVFCSCRSYDEKSRFSGSEKLDGVLVKRLFATGFGRRSYLGRLADYASFYLSLFIALALESKRPDLVLSLTTPPYVGLLGKFAAWRHRCRHAHWVMDLYPDVMLAHGMAAQNKIVFRLLKKMSRFQYAGAQTLLALGPIMAERISAYAPNVGWLPLWSDMNLSPMTSGEIVSLRNERGWGRDETVFLYSGNMGLGHRFGEFLEAAKRLGPSGPRWVFSGGGKRRGKLEAFAKANASARIELRDYVPRSELRAHLCSADVHIASLDSSWQGLIVPSKLQASFAVGRPVLFVGGRNCETAAWIAESGGGWVVDENDFDGLMEAIQQALNPVERRRRGAAALSFANKNFHPLRTCTRLAELIEGESHMGQESRAAAAGALTAMLARKL